MAQGTMPDFTRCQAEIQDAHSAFRLGPRPAPQRCDKQSEYLVFETKADADGYQGSMCLCGDCADQLHKQTVGTDAYQFLDIHAGSARYV